MSYKQNILEKVFNYCHANYKRINDNDLILGNLLYNRKCHLNSVQNVLEGNADKVYLCVAVAKNNYMDIIVHFINKNKDGKYIDNTLGWTYKFYNYYIVRKINEDEYNEVADILVSTKKFLIEQNSNRLLNKLYKIDEDLI